MIAAITGLLLVLVVLVLKKDEVAVVCVWT